ncbi:MAG: amidohydrolase family protein [Desulfomonilaceae bacterium]
MKKIVLEEAVVIPGQEDVVPEHGTHPEFRDNYAKLLDITGQRLQDMDANEIEVSVLSATAPGLQGVNDRSAAPRLAREWNNYLAEAIAKHADRLKAFAVLPTGEPQLAAEELSRCVQDLGFVGALVNGYDNGGGSQPLYYDAPQYLDFWRAAADLDVPVYVHPRSVPDDRTTTYSGYPELRGAAWGFHVETAEHMLRLILSGLFDKVPGLRIIIGHIGELLPFWTWRIDHRIEREGWRDRPETKDRPRKHTVTEYLCSNFYVTTSGYFETAGLEHTLKVIGADRVLYSVDYPYEDSREANNWFEALALDESDKRKIAYDNAASLLKIR